MCPARFLWALASFCAAAVSQEIDDGSGGTDDDPAPRPRMSKVKHDDRAFVETVFVVILVVLFLSMYAATCIGYHANPISTTLPNKKDWGKLQTRSD